MVEKTVRPSLAKRLAMAAALTATLLNPVRDMVNVISPEVDIMEIACAPESTLTGVFEQHGYNGFRVNYKTGFNLDLSTQCVSDGVWCITVSIWCQRASPGSCAWVPASRNAETTTNRWMV